MIRDCLCLICIIFAPFAAFAENLLQDAIDKAPEGALITLNDGLYKGKLVINKSITIEGKGDNAVIMGDGTGSVITVKTSYVTLKNLTVMGSGETHDSIDSCIRANNADNIKIIGNRMSDCLFGVNFEQVNRSEVEDNSIESKRSMPLGLKGDGIRLWYSHSNSIRNNIVNYVRDVVFWYSSANQIESNHVTNSRYSLHFMYADRNVVVNNVFDNNSVGAFFMFSHSSRVLGNKVMRATGPFGIGIGMKECSDFLVTDNTLLYNARGFYLDQSPYQPDTTNTYLENKITYNTVGIQFHGTTIGSIFERNMFKGNMEALSNDTPESRLDLNKWHENVWDSYEGFDFDKDNYGDTPMVARKYADSLWLYNPNVKFFYSSPAMSLLNFLARLLPFSEPEILATDDKPALEHL